MQSTKSKVPITIPFDPDLRRAFYAGRDGKTLSTDESLSPPIVAAWAHGRSERQALLKLKETAMNFDFRTKQGMQTILNLIVIAVMTVMGAIYKWDEPTLPEPSPTVIAIQDPVAEAVDLAPEDSRYIVTAYYPSQDEAENVRSFLSTDHETNPVPISGLSIGFIVAMLNLFSQYFGKK